MSEAEGNPIEDRMRGSKLHSLNYILRMKNSPKWSVLSYVRRTPFSEWSLLPRILRM